jgi:glycosyltransferase involved in cell wall biosynthesis
MSTPGLDVAILHSSLGLVRGGLETTAARLAEGLAGRGHRVTLVCGARPWRQLPADLAALPVRSVRVPCVPVNLRAWRAPAHRRPGLPLKVQSFSFVQACRLDPRVRRLIDTADVTLTELEVETVLFSEWRARRGRPNVSLCPGGIEAKWLLRDRSRVRLALSEVAAGPVAALGLQVDDVVFLPGPPAWWLELPYTTRPDARTLLFVGRLEPNKGVWELLALFETLAPRFPELRLRLVGDGPERPALERRLAASGLTGRVQIVGAVAPEQVLRELRSADLFVFPSHYESWGLALVEAMAAGVPVVASDLPGCREVAGEAARLVPVYDPAAWADATGQLIADPAERRRLSLAGRERAARFTAERAVEIMERWLFRALERRVAPPDAWP